MNVTTPSPRRGMGVGVALLFGICLLVMTSCMGSSNSAMATGGEVTGVKGTSFSEPVPFGMVPVRKGSLRIGWVCKRKL